MLKISDGLAVTNEHFLRESLCHKRLAKYRAKCLASCMLTPNLETALLEYFIILLLFYKSVGPTSIAHYLVVSRSSMKSTVSRVAEIYKDIQSLTLHLMNRIAGDDFEEGDRWSCSGSETATPKGNGKSSLATYVHST